MPVTEDMAGATEKTKQELQQVLLNLLKGNADILNSVTQAASQHGGYANEASPRSGDEGGRRDQRSPKMSSFPEEENNLNQPGRASYQWQLSDSDDGIDSAWTTTTRNMSPRELHNWRKSLYSIYVGHLPYDITKKELVQLFSEVGSVQDAHLQPGKDRGYTYGVLTSLSSEFSTVFKEEGANYKLERFIRFCTLEECHDAVSLLHGRLLGNRTITVEYACETKDRLQGEDPSDLPQDKKDKLLRNDYPRVEHLYRPMSTEESQEKMILWKLRCSATRLKSSTTISGQENKEEFMNKIQEVVRKVASLSADTQTLPSGSEGSPCSPWILRELNGNSGPEQKAQSNLTDNCQEQYRGVGRIQPQVTGSDAIDVVNKKELLETPQRHERSPEASSKPFSPPDLARSIGLGPDNDSSTSGFPGSPPKDACNSSLSDSVSVGSTSPERPIGQHCQFRHSGSLSHGHASESSQSESTSSSPSRQLSLSPGTIYREEEEISKKRDGCPSLAEQGTDNSQYGLETCAGYTNNPDSRCHGPPSRNHYSDMGLCYFDSARDCSTKPSGITSQLGNHHAHQQPKAAVNSGFFRGQKQAQFSPVTSQERQSQQGSLDDPVTKGRHANSSPVHQGILTGPPYSVVTNLDVVNQELASNSSEIVGPKPPLVPTQHPSPEQIRGPPVVQHGLPRAPFCPENASAGKEGQRRTQYSSAVIQPQQASVPRHHLNQEKVQVVSEAIKPITQKGPPTGNTGVDREGSRRTYVFSAMTEQQQAGVPSHLLTQNKAQVVNNGNTPFAQQEQLRVVQGHENTSVSKEIQRGMQYSSAVTQSQHASLPSHHPSQEQVRVVNDVNKPSAQQGHTRCPVGPMSTNVAVVPQPQQAPVPSHRPNQEKGQVVNEKKKPFVCLSLSGKPSAKNDDVRNKGQTRHEQYSPDKPEPQQSYVPKQHVNQPFAQDSLFGFPPLAKLLGQSQQLQVIQLANLMASGWHQPGFPRHPFFTPGTFNPGNLQGWNPNPFLQQQFAASRMPFGSPFQGEERQVRPRFGFGVTNPVSRQGQRHQVPVGRGSNFAPRFRNPVTANVKAAAEPEKSVSEMSKLASVDPNLIEVKSEFDVDGCKKEQNAASDSPKDSGRQEKQPTTPYNTKAHVESAGQTLVAPRQYQEKSPSAEKFKAISPMSDTANSPPGSILPKVAGDFESPGTNTSPSKMTQSEIHLKEEKAELKRIGKENERLRQCIDWNNSGGISSDTAKEKRDSLRAEIHNKEVQLQKEKEIIIARKAEQEILYEREKLEAAFDQQLKKELETEKRLGETKNKIYLARLENELLRCHQDLHGVIAIAEKH